MGDLSDTICAVSTAPGRAGMAVVRMSGGATREILERVASGASGPDAFPERLAVLSRLADPRLGSELDQALVTFFRAPRSYTGEDVAEISLHGSPVLVAAVLDVLCSQGARLAEPGEFTMRAFLRGRMDLAQAEAVRDVIDAQTLYQARVAARQRAGELSHSLEPAKELLMDLIVNMESAVEFVEEDLPQESREVLGSRLDTLRDDLRVRIASFRRGRIIRDGFALAIVGRPNVGKSSLFNALIMSERAIVTEFPGTTRDLVSEVTSIGGIPVHLVDTAGVRAPENPVEQLGVDRSLRALSDADAVLLVVDGSEKPHAGDSELRDRLGGHSWMLVVNKIDLPQRWAGDCVGALAGETRVFRVSAKTRAGIDELREGIHQHLAGPRGAEGDGVLVTTLRHAQCLERAAANLDQAADALRRGLPEEFALIGLRSALREIGAITGETAVEEILGGIFSKFCVGK